MMTIQSYLEQYHQWQPQHVHAAILRGRCPIHPERHPSFLVDTKDEHCYCFHEQRRIDLAGLINVLEYGDIDSRVVWQQCFQRIDELNDRHPSASSQEQGFHPALERKRISVTREQRAVLTAAMHWWHECLWSRTPWMQSARGQRYFEQERGIAIRDLRGRVQIGYAPPWSKLLASSFADQMQAAIGNDWKRPAMEVGLIWQKSGTMRLQDRVMFCSMDDEGDCLFFQGRYVEFKEEGNAHKQDRHYYKCLSASTIHKEPFTLKIDHPAIPGTTHIESPFGTVMLALYNLPAYAWLGAVPTGTSLAQIPGPHWLVQDNDAPHRSSHGQIYFPGEIQAQKFSKICQQEQVASTRIEPPAIWKDLDTWVKQEGIHAYTAALEQHIIVR